MPGPLLLLPLIIKFILANGARAGVKKYGPQLVKQALKKMKVKEKVIARRVPHSTKRSSEASRSRALENQLKQERGIRLEAEFDSPLDILNPPIEGVPLEFQRGGTVGLNIPSLTMLPESIRPIKHQTYKDRLDESLGMRRGPERDFRQSLADRRDESIGASLGRYGERGLPSLARRKTIPRVTREPRLGAQAPRTGIDTSALPFIEEGGNYDPTSSVDFSNFKASDFFGNLPSLTTAPVMPIAPKTLEEILAQINETEPGMIGPPGTTISPIQEAVNAAVGGTPPIGPIGGDTEPGVAITDPVQEAVNAAIGGGAGAEEILYYNPATGSTTRTSNSALAASEGFIPMPEGGIPYDPNRIINPGWEIEYGDTVGGGAVDEDLGFFDSSWWAPNPVGEGDEVPFMDQLQAMVDQILAQQGEQQTAQQQAQQQQAQQAQNYTLTGPSIGYNPYTSGQYQADPYGAAGVPDMGGLTTIPVPDPWQPPTLQPWGT